MQRLARDAPRGRCRCCGASSELSRDSVCRRVPPLKRDVEGGGQAAAQPTSQSGRSCAKKRARLAPDSQRPGSDQKAEQEQAESDIGLDEYEYNPKRVRLTSKNLERLNKMNNASSKPSARPGSIGGFTTSTETTSSFSSLFPKDEQLGYLKPSKSKPPTNLEEIRERFARSRATTSPPESEYRRYVENLSAPQPDFAEGLEMKEYDLRHVGKCISGPVLYKHDPLSRSTTIRIRPGWKESEEETMKEARRESARGGAALVSARNEALSILSRSDPPGHAEIITFTTDGTTLNFFAHHDEAPSEDGNRVKHHQYHLASVHIKDTYKAYKDGRRGFRNLQDYAWSQTWALIDQVREHRKQLEEQCHPGPHPTAEGTSRNDSNDSAEVPLTA
ncbi:hypothetical protein CDD83_6302 [Cordyceps sp. RAO-2017]|nr:hypothetical protein CDD83_6302 [Cordyceps sp. RAO-2017]